MSSRSFSSDTALWNFQLENCISNRVWLAGAKRFLCPTASACTMNSGTALTCRLRIVFRMWTKICGWMSILIVCSCVFASDELEINKNDIHRHRTSGYLFYIWLCLSVCLSVCPCVSVSVRRITQKLVDKLRWTFWRGGVRDQQQQLTRYCRSDDDANTGIFFTIAEYGMFTSFTDKS